jgi:hypothetical protein
MIPFSDQVELIEEIRLVRLTVRCQLTLAAGFFFSGYVVLKIFCSCPLLPGPKRAFAHVDQGLFPGCGLLFLS